MMILVTGAKGLLGSDLVRVLSKEYEAIGVGKEDFDITDKGATLKSIRDIAPELVIHTAAYTKVDACESNREFAFRVNRDGAGNVAMACREVGARLFYISTDYVFDGKKESPYSEEDTPNPLSIYGRSKWEGEQQIKKIMSDYIIMRTSWLFGRNGPNFVKTILGLAEGGGVLKVVDDQRGSPTYSVDLSEAIRRLIKIETRGIIHVTNSGSCTWFEYTKRILEMAGHTDIKVIPISSAESNRPATRPAYSVLSNDRYWRLTSHKLRPWQEAVEEYIMSSELR